MKTDRATGLLLPVLFSASCAMHHQPTRRADYGIVPCPAEATAHLLTIEALQCWFEAPHGRWRTLSHESHFAVLVVNVEAADLRDAEAITTRFVDGERETFAEILVYVKRERRTDRDATRRVRWTRDAGFEMLDFDDQQ